MPTAPWRVRPAAAPEDLSSEGSAESGVHVGEVSADHEASHLELHLQAQLEEDIARIFDESIYSDLEVVCGKLKVLTHSCILKARTDKFYHKLQSIPHVDITRDAFDEIYSFISDAYTECNIKSQENEIIAYLEDNLKSTKGNLSTKEEGDDQDVFLTPKCPTPYVEKTFQQSISDSPSIELTKEYYSLVHIEGQEDRELEEQDALSNAFQSIIKTKAKARLLRSKPTSLSLPSSHIIYQKHSKSCDILNNIKDNTSELPKKSGVVQPSQWGDKLNDLVESSLSNVTKAESAYSPDSLFADEASSSSDYLSAAYASPGVSTSVGIPLLNVGDFTKMDKTYTLSDSGVESSGTLGSLTSHKDITLTDVSLTESMLHDLTTDESHDSNSFDKNHLLRIKLGTYSTTSCMSSEVNGTTPQSPKLRDVGRKSSKEEKQRQNEEIVILESSSVSSETGSWESVFPPKVAAKEACEKFITSERQCSIDRVIEKPGAPNYANTLAASLVQKSPFKSTSCFIDAASLLDEEDETIKVQTDGHGTEERRNKALPAPSQPVPCSTAKFDVSPNEWAEINDNDDSLEQVDNEEPDPDSNQKDLSPTIFDMTPLTEDSLCTNAFETAALAEETTKQVQESEEEHRGYSSERDPFHSNTDLVSRTPYNSILSLRASSLKQYESEESVSDTTVVGSMGANKTTMKFNESIPILSGGASVVDHLPLMASHSSSPLTRRRIENIPIVSGAYVPKVDEKTYRKSPKPSNASAWVVDMSDLPKTEEKSSIVKKPSDRKCELLRNASKSSLDSCHSLENNKSRSSIDSDGSEKSSHKFYIDLSQLPDPKPSKNNENESSNEKKNIFSMYIDLSEKPIKEMPARLSSSLNMRKNNNESQNISKSYKTANTSSETENSDGNMSLDNTLTYNTSIKHFESSSLNMRKNKSSETENSDGNMSLDNTLTYNTSIKNFEKCESLCSDPNINITEIINMLDNESSSKEKHHSTEEVVMKSQEIIKGKSPRHASEICKPAPPALQEEPVASQADLFVKLSDLDKPVQVTKSWKRLDVRMTRSIPENSWGDEAGGSSRLTEVFSSFHSENALSLNRIFPHLRTELSRSMGALNPGGRSPLMMTSSELTAEEPSDVSEVSSVQSSMCRSIVENSTTEDSSRSSSLVLACQSRLGQDLLRMFLQEIGTDVIVEVSGRRIPAHKCILSSRCQYFAGILSGGWVESAGNVIVLPPFSYNVVHFALCHIYSGVATIPDSISILELATIADMLCLEGLKEVIMFTLKEKYCHHFHRPCTVCTAGVLECLPLSSVYGLDDLYRKCLRWISKHFSRVWPTKAFATLPKELLDKCYHNLIVNMTTENVIDTVYGCGITVEVLAKSRWAEVVARMCRRLVNAAAHFVAPRLEAVLRLAARLPPDPPPPAAQALDDCLAVAIEWAAPEETCRAYAFLSEILKEIRVQQQPKPDLLSDGQKPTPSYALEVRADSWKLQCEEALVKARVVSTQAFEDLQPELRKRLKELGCITYGPSPATIKEKKTRILKKNNALDIDHVRTLFVPYSPRPAAASGDALRSNNDLRDKRLNSKTPKVRTTKAQEERAKFNLNKKSQEEKPATTVPARLTFENTKPRYLEPRIPKESERKLTPGKKLAPKMISSSESSRNSSPIQARNARCGGGHRVETSTQDMSQDSLASRPRTAEPSTESLSESQHSNKYATYTKVKHVKGSVESIPSSRYCISSQQQSSYKTKIPVYVNQARTNGPGCSGAARTNGAGCSGAARTNAAGCVGAARTNGPGCSGAARTNGPGCSGAARTNGPGCSGAARTNGPGCSGAARTNGPGCSGAARTNGPGCSGAARPNGPGCSDAARTNGPGCSGAARTNGSGCSGAARTNGPGCSGAAQTNGPGCSGAQKKPSPKHAAPRRPALGSLMTPTKSSSAKMVPKVIKTSKDISKPKKVTKPDPAPEIPTMERSGTFLKDEATFGDKTTNIDIDHE